MKTISTFVALIFIAISCQNEPKAVQNMAKTADSTLQQVIQQVPQQVFYARPTFLSTTKIDSMDIPRTVVSFAFGKTVEAIDTTVTGDFHLLEPVEMKQLKLPKSCIVAGKAFWAGLQVVLTIDSTKNGYTVKRQYEDESTTGKEPFEVIKSFPK